jgi:hypothetical protein
LIGLTYAKGITLPNDIGVTDPRDTVFQRVLAYAWSRDVVVVCAAGNEGVGPLQTQTLDRITPQHFGTDTNPLITVGGAISNGSLWYQTTPFNPPPNARFPNLPAPLGALTGGSITVYAQALDVRTTRSGTGDFQTGTSFASPQVVSGSESCLS